MKKSLRIDALALLACAGNALAHPGHGAPSVHAHDLDELLAMAAAILVSTVIGLGVAAVVRTRK